MSPRVIVSPEPSLADAEVDITCCGLPANTLVTLRATSHSGQNAFESYGVFQVNEHGENNLDKQPSLAGSYFGVDKMGLFWSMDPSPYNDVQFSRFTVKDVARPDIVVIRVYNKQFFSIKDLILNDEKNVVASCQVTRLYMKPGTKRVVVKEQNVEGTLFIPPGNGPFPGVIYILGAMANPIETHASLMSSHGFVTFNLKYFGFKNWVFNIDMTQMESALNFVRNLAVVKYDGGVSVVGVCKGGQFALCMAECLDGIKSVVAINAPIAPVHNSHQYKNKSWPTLDTDEVTPYTFGKHGALLSRTLIPVLTDFDEDTLSKSLFKFYTRHDVPCLVVAALGDSNIPSEHYCNKVERLLKTARHPHYGILRYAGAGHLLEPPYTPFCCRSSGNPFTELFEWGGIKIPHCKAQIDCWKKITQFLHNNAMGLPTSKL